jgi:tetratricopeptide (TPR) repeat protein
MYNHHFDRGEERKQLAREAATRALELEPGLPEANFAMGSYHYRVMRDYAKAVSTLDAALQGKPNDSRIYAVLGYVERRRGRWEDAVEHFLQTLRLNPRDAGVAYVIAETYMLMKEYALADEYCQVSLTIETNQPDAQVMLVRNFWQRYGSADSTRALIDTALSKYFGWILEPYLQLIYDGRFLEAVKSCDSLPDNQLWHGNWIYPGDQLRGWAYFLIGDTASAGTYFQSAATELEKRLELPSSSPRDHSELGILFAYLGKTDEAIRHARKAVELLPVSKDAYEGPDRLQDLALVLTIAGREDEAVSLVDSLLKTPSDLSVPLLRLDKRWNPLYDHPRFQALIEKYEKEHAL